MHNALAFYSARNVVDTARLVNNELEKLDVKSWIEGIKKLTRFV